MISWLRTLRSPPPGPADAAALVAIAQALHAESIGAEEAARRSSEWGKRLILYDKLFEELAVYLRPNPTSLVNPRQELFPALGSCIVDGFREYLAQHPVEAERVVSLAAPLRSVEGRQAFVQIRLDELAAEALAATGSWRQAAQTLLRARDRLLRMMVLAQPTRSYQADYALLITQLGDVRAQVAGCPPRSRDYDNLLTRLGTPRTSFSGWRFETQDLWCLLLQQAEAEAISLVGLEEALPIFAQASEVLVSSAPGYAREAKLWLALCERAEIDWEERLKNVVRAAFARRPEATIQALIWHLQWGLEAAVHRGIEEHLPIEQPVAERLEDCLTRLPPNHPDGPWLSAVSLLALSRYQALLNRGADPAIGMMVNRLRVCHEQRAALGYDLDLQLCVALDYAALLLTASNVLHDEGLFDEGYRVVHGLGEEASIRFRQEAAARAYELEALLTLPSWSPARLDRIEHALDCLSKAIALTDAQTDPLNAYQCRFLLLLHRLQQAELTRLPGIIAKARREAQALAQATVDPLFSASRGPILALAGWAEMLAEDRDQALSRMAEAWAILRPGGSHPSREKIWDVGLRRQLVMRYEQLLRETGQPAQALGLRAELRGSDQTNAIFKSAKAQRSRSCSGPAPGEAWLELCHLDLCFRLFVTTTDRSGKLVTESPDLSWYDLPDLIRTGQAWASTRPDEFNPFNLEAVEQRLERLLASFGTALAPIVALLEQRGIRRITLLPQTWFHEIPFHALRVPSGVRWVDCFEAISYAAGMPGISLGPECLRSAWLFGPDPTLSLAQEQAALQAHQARIVLHEEANKETLQRAFAEGTLIHLACHGLFVPEAPLTSWLYLANQESIRLQELLTWTDRRADGPLVVLAACWSGRGSDTSRKFYGDTYLGLDRAFLEAGAGGVISSMWALDDKMAGPLFRAFYEELGSTDIATALTRALRRSSQPNPLQWGPLRYLSG